MGKFGPTKLEQTTQEPLIDREKVLEIIYSLAEEIVFYLSATKESPFFLEEIQNKDFYQEIKDDNILKKAKLFPLKIYIKLLRLDDKALSELADKFGKYVALLKLYFQVAKTREESKKIQDHIKNNSETVVKRIKKRK